MLCLHRACPVPFSQANRGIPPFPAFHNPASRLHSNPVMVSGGVAEDEWRVGIAFIQKTLPRFQPLRQRLEEMDQIVRMTQRLILRMYRMLSMTEKPSATTNAHQTMVTLPVTVPMRYAHGISTKS